MAGKQERDSTKAGATSARDSRTALPSAPDGDANPRAGLEREVGDLEDPDAVEDDGALPGRVGGGLAGG
ncbi:hypothetical protein [Lysobacter sp. A3-1-A15]|uniref:hypothetical protein n=1 Tax=Novilysobacter viscosus TaxID=3098602 RepID=UPI002ED7BDFF